MKKIIALAALTAVVSMSASADINTFGGSLTGDPAINQKTQHSVQFLVNPSYQPLTFVDTVKSTPNDLNGEGEAHRVIIASKFTPTSGHQYEVSTPVVAGANAGAQLDTSFSSSDSTPPNTTAKFAKAADSSDVFILLTQTSQGALQPGSTTASYTVTDYNS